jgi:TRAP-type C4-dicarboxylate transport system permease small subunit
MIEPMGKMQGLLPALKSGTKLTVVVLIGGMFAYASGIMGYMTWSYAVPNHDKIGIAIGLCFSFAYMFGIYVCIRALASIFEKMMKVKRG